MEVHVNNLAELQAFGARLGAALAGGVPVALVGDVGAGKTTLTKAIAVGMGIEGDVSSPSYALNQTYEAPSGLRLVHYDFYRLSEPGILAQELKETLADSASVVVVEWSDIVASVLPSDTLTIEIFAVNDSARILRLSAGGEKSQAVIGSLA